jgi:hypothetical protein
VQEVDLRKSAAEGTLLSQPKTETDEEGEDEEEEEEEEEEQQPQPQPQQQPQQPQQQQGVEEVVVDSFVVPLDDGAAVRGLFLGEGLTVREAGMHEDEDRLVVRGVLIDREGQRAALIFRCTSHDDEARDYFQPEVVPPFGVDGSVIFEPRLRRACRRGLLKMTMDCWCPTDGYDFQSRSELDIWAVLHRVVVPQALGGALMSSEQVRRVVKSNGGLVSHLT